jgi:Na+-driven multidrug efflux pump
MSSAGFTSYLAGRGHVIYNTWGTVLALVATVTLDILLIPRWGIVGAAVASLASYTVTFAVALLCFSRVSRYFVKDVFKPRRSDFAFLADLVVRFAAAGRSR